jgi:hypothetical protein
MCPDLVEYEPVRFDGYPSALSECHPVFDRAVDLGLLTHRACINVASAV